MLTVDGISVRLGGRDVLQDVRFFAIRAEHEFVGLIGSNGAGKDHAAARHPRVVQEPSAGTVRIADAGRARRAPAIGYVPQKVLLDPDMPLRARDVVGLGLDGNRLGIPLPSRGRRHLIDEMLRAVGAELFGDERIGNLSGGEQQRVLIAHALISRPSLLLLDEPLANLDIRSEQEIFSPGCCSRHGLREQHISVLLTAHEMNPLLPVIDRVVYLAAGRAASGTTDEVVTTEVLSKLYGQHVDVIHVHGRILVVAGRGDGPALPVGEDGAHCAVPPVPDRL